MNYLVTGGNGFVGRELIAELIRRNHRVKAAVRSFGGLPVGAEVCPIGSIDGRTDWVAGLRDVDVVVHLAARVHVMRDTAANPLAKFLEVNLDGTKNLLRQAAQAGVKRLVYISSIGVNGNRTYGNHVFSEADDPSPHNDYATSKWKAEQALCGIAVATRPEVVIVRPPLIYGPAAKGNFPKLLAAIAKGYPLPLAGANNSRSLIYVGNLVDALIACATHPAAAGQTYLVRDGEDISIAFLIEAISRALGVKCRSFYLPLGLLRAAASMLGRREQIGQLLGSLRVSDEKIRKELGWAPPYRLEQGLSVTADWYRGHLE